MYLKYTLIVPTVSCIEIFILLTMYKCYNDKVLCVQLVLRKTHSFNITYTATKAFC